MSLRVLWILAIWWKIWRSTRMILSPQNATISTATARYRE